MGYSNTAYKTDIMTRSRDFASLGHLHGALEQTGRNIAIDNLFAEGGDSFYNYVDWIGLINDPDLIVLSSIHHFYFDNDDMKNINTVINLKQLNLIKDIDGFLNSIIRILPEKSNFVGCFLDHKIQYENTLNNITSQYRGTSINNKVDPYENGITSRVPFINTVYNLIDSKTNRLMTHDNVHSLLSKKGFKVLDMTDMNGLTYFHSQKPGNLRN